MAVHLGKYSQSSYVGAEKCVLCAQLFVVLRKNTFTAQNPKYTCAESSTFGCTETFTTCAEAYQQIYVVCRNIISDTKIIILCAEITGSLAQILWFPTIVGMSWCCGWVIDPKSGV